MSNLFYSKNHHDDRDPESLRMWQVARMASAMAYMLKNAKDPNAALLAQSAEDIMNNAMHLAKHLKTMENNEHKN